MSNRRPRHALSRARDMIPALDAAAKVRRFMVFSTDGDGGALIPGNLCRCVVGRFRRPARRYAMAAGLAIQGPTARSGRGAMEARYAVPARSSNLGPATVLGSAAGGAARLMHVLHGYRAG